LAIEELRAVLVAGAGLSRDGGRSVVAEFSFVTVLFARWCVAPRLGTWLEAVVVLSADVGRACAAAFGLLELDSGGYRLDASLREVPS